MYRTEKIEIALNKIDSQLDLQLYLRQQKESSKFEGTLFLMHKNEKSDKEEILKYDFKCGHINWITVFDNQ